MTIATRVETDGARAVVVKRSGAIDAERLRREGERLQRASHPGVVQVARSGPSGDGWELRTAHAGRPLSILGRLAVREVAAVVAAVASTLADLHDLGVVHGRIDACRVLLSGQGRPVLCGFGDGTAPARREDDVAALGGLLGHLLGTDDEEEPIPDRRWRRPRRWSGWDRRALLLLADQACAEPITRRPTARRLAAAIAEAVPDLRGPSVSPPPLDDELSHDVHDRVGLPSALVSAAGPRTRIPAAGLAVLGGLVLAVAGVLVSGPRSAEAPGPPEATAPPVTTRSATIAAGSELTVGGRRYRVGQEGDELLVEDWDCDGTATPALLRPATGEVFVFPRWIARAELAVEPVLQVADASALVSEVTPDGCPMLAVHTTSGERVPVVQASNR